MLIAFDIKKYNSNSHRINTSAGTQFGDNRLAEIRFLRSWDFAVFIGCLIAVFIESRAGGGVAILLPSTDVQPSCG